jgi:LacI family transcriptional regulator
MMAKKAQAGIKDVARRAGVSLGTVSHVLNHPERVTPALMERVTVAMEELNFVRNGAASQLRAGRQMSIGLVVPDVSNPFFAAVARGAEDEADARGYSVLILNAAESHPRERRHLQFLVEQRVAGVLLTPVDDRELAVSLSTIASGGIPFVLVDHVTTDESRCSVAVDDVRGGELAGQHLLSQGATRIAYVGGPRWIRQCADRLRGLEVAIAGAETAATITHVQLGGLSWRAGYDAIEQVMASSPDAVFCANDVVALGVLRGVIEMGLSVPKDLSIVGYDDIDFAASAAVPLTSIRQPAYQIGKTAAALLLDEALDPEGHAHQQVLFRPELILRASAPAGRDRRAPRRSARTGTG